MTTKRALSMLPNYTGKVEEYDTWRFQMIQFLLEDVYRVEQSVCVQTFFDRGLLFLLEYSQVVKVYHKGASSAARRHPLHLIVYFEIPSVFSL